MKERTPIDPDLKNYFELQVLKQLFEDNFFAFVDGKPGNLSPVELAERAFNIAHVQGYTDFTANHRSQLIEALEQLVVTYADICRKWSVLKYKFVDIKFSILGGWRQYRIHNDGITGNVLKVSTEVRMNSGRTALELYNEDVVKATVYLIDRMNYNYRTDQLQEWNIQNNLIVWKDIIQGNGFLNFILTKERTGVVPMRVVVSTQTRPLIKPLPPPPTPVPWPWPQPGPYPMPLPPGPPIQPGVGPVPGAFSPPTPPPPHSAWQGPIPGPWGRDGGEKVAEGGGGDTSEGGADEMASWAGPWPDPHYPVPGPAPIPPGPQAIPDPYGPPVPGPQPTPIYPTPPTPPVPPAPVPYWPPPPPPPPVVADCALTRTVVAERSIGGIYKGDVLPAGLTFTVFVEWLLRGTDPVSGDTPTEETAANYIFSAAIPLKDSTGSKFVPTGDDIAGYTATEIDEKALQSTIKVEIPCKVPDAPTMVIAVPETLLDNIAWFESDGATSLTLPKTANNTGGKDYTVSINNKSYKVYLWDSNFYGTQTIVLKYK